MYVANCFARYTVDMVSYNSGMRSHPILKVSILILLSILAYPYISLGRLPHTEITTGSPFGDINQYIDKGNIRLYRLSYEVRQQMQRFGLSLPAAVEHITYKTVKYREDIDNWGVPEFVPSTDEVLSRGYEDCDGQVITAVSLLLNMGYPADKLLIKVGAGHVWLRMGDTEILGPRTASAVFALDGTRLWESTSSRWWTRPQLGTQDIINLSLFCLMMVLVICTHPKRRVVRYTAYGAILCTVALLATLLLPKTTRSAVASNVAEPVTPSGVVVAGPSVVPSQTGAPSLPPVAVPMVEQR